MKLGTDIQIINLISNVGALGLLAYLTIFGMPKLIGAAKEALDNSRKACDERNQVLTGLLLKVMMLQYSAPHERDAKARELKEKIDRIIEKKPTENQQ